MRGRLVAAILVLVLACGLAGCSREVGGPLLFTVPKDWKAELKGPGHVDRYVITTEKEGEGYLMFLPDRNRLSADEHAFALQFGATVSGAMSSAMNITRAVTPTTKDELPPLPQPKVEHFAGECWKGSMMKMSVSESGFSFTGVTFFFTIDGWTWEGQFVGNEKRWEEALALLKGIKRRNA